MTFNSKQSSIAKLIQASATMLFSLALAGCGGGGGSPGTVGVTTGTGTGTGTGSTGLLPLSVLPNGATANVGDILNFIVSGGTPPYSITVTNTSVASSPVTPSTGAFATTLLNAGTTNVTIVDSLGQTTTVGVTATQTATLLRLSPSALILGEDSTDPIILNIFGGMAPYTAITSDLQLSSVSITGTASAPTLTVGTGVRGSRCINPVDGTGKYITSGTYDITVTVKDNLGASATNTLTIKDNGAGLTPSGC